MLTVCSGHNGRGHVLTIAGTYRSVGKGKEAVRNQIFDRSDSHDTHAIE